MVTLRQIQEVKAGIITIQLPLHFQAKRVEVLITPIAEENERQIALENLLLAAPTITDTEVEKYQEVSDWMKTWNVNEF